MVTMPRYDVFISYRWVDPDMYWVRDHLAPALQGAGLRTLLDVQDFVPGRDLILEMDRAGRESRYVLCVLSPEYFDGDRMVAFESLNARRSNPSGSDSRLIPLLLRPTQMPNWIRGLVPIDWTDDRGRGREWTKLLEILGAPRNSGPPPKPPGGNLPGVGVAKSLASISEATPDAVIVLRNGRFEATCTSENRGNVLKCRISDRDRELRYGDIIQLWKRDIEFVDFFISIFKKCGFTSYAWETPSVCVSTIGRVFEFAVCNAPAASQIPDRNTYASYFNTKTSNEGIVAFNNLGGMLFS